MYHMSLWIPNLSLCRSMARSLLSTSPRLRKTKYNCLRNMPVPQTWSQAIEVRLWRRRHSRMMLKNLVALARDAHNKTVNKLQYKLPTMPYTATLTSDNTIYCNTCYLQYNILGLSDESVQYIGIVRQTNTIHCIVRMNQNSALFTVKYCNTLHYISTIHCYLS